MQMSTYSETTRGELDRTQKKLVVVEEEKAAALASCAAAAKEGTNQCQRDLDAASGAKIQVLPQFSFRQRVFCNSECIYRFNTYLFVDLSKSILNSLAHENCILGVNAWIHIHGL